MQGSDIPIPNNDEGFNNGPEETKELEPVIE